MLGPGVLGPGRLGLGSVPESPFLNSGSFGTARPAMSATSWIAIKLKYSFTNCTSFAWILAGTFLYFTDEDVNKPPNRLSDTKITNMFGASLNSAFVTMYKMFIFPSGMLLLA